MALPLKIPIQTDYIAATGESLQTLRLTLLNTIEQTILNSLELVSNNPHHTAQEFWEYQETDGKIILDELKYWISVLYEKAPDKITAELLASGSTLIVSDDGSVSLPPG